MKAVYCPYCGGRTKRNGRTSSGSQRWRCTACGASTTVRYDDTATRLDEFLGWLLSKDSQAAMPGGGRSFKRVKAEFWWCHAHSGDARTAREKLATMPTDADIDFLFSVYSASPPRDDGGPEWGDRVVWEDLHHRDPYPFWLD